MGKDLIEELINTLPDFNFLARKLIRKNFFFFQKKKFKEKFKKPLDFFF